MVEHQNANQVFAGSMALRHYLQGRLSPPTTMALFPPFSRLTPSFPATLPAPRKQFLDTVYTILCNFMRIFSEFWKLSGIMIMTPKTKNRLYMELVKHIACFHF